MHTYQKWACDFDGWLGVLVGSLVLGTCGPLEEGAVNKLGHGLGESGHTLSFNLWVVRVKHVNDRKFVKARLYQNDWFWISFSSLF